MGQEESGQIRSVSRACEILEALYRAGGEAPLKEISQYTALNKSTAHGILATLEHERFVVRTSNGAYALGLRLLELGTAAVTRLDLRSQATEVLHNLVRRFGETVHLVTREGADVVYIDKVESSQSVRIVSQVGSRLPAVCTGVGKAILAVLPSDELERLLAGVELKPYTRNTITEMHRLREQLQEVRRRGYAIDDEEIVDGLRCVAAPIFNHTGSCVAALSLSGPSARMGFSRLGEMIPALCEGAAEVSRRLGNPSAPGDWHIL